MIKANELRIGNYFTTQKNSLSSYCVIKSISDNIGFLIKDGERLKKINHVLFSKAFPIELDEIWLNKFGFEQSNFNGSWYNMPFENNEGMFLSINLHYGICGIEQYKNIAGDFRYVRNDIGIINKITNVHSLQNLYFSLTGEELQAKQL